MIYPDLMESGFQSPFGPNEDSDTPASAHQKFAVR